MLGCYRANAAAELFNTKRGKALPYRQLSKHGLIRAGSCQHLLPETCFFRFYIYDSGASSLSSPFKCRLLRISAHLKHVLTVALIKKCACLSRQSTLIWGGGHRRTEREQPAVGAVVISLSSLFLCHIKWFLSLF